jgi:hypothetical protein
MNVPVTTSGMLWPGMAAAPSRGAAREVYVAMAQAEVFAERGQPPASTDPVGVPDKFTRHKLQIRSGPRTFMCVLCEPETNTAALNRAMALAGRALQGDVSTRTGDAPLTRAAPTKPVDGRASTICCDQRFRCRARHAMAGG